MLRNSGSLRRIWRVGRGRRLGRSGWISIGTGRSRCQQYEAFHRQIEWAVQYRLPIVIHSRDSMKESIGVVREHQQGGLRGDISLFWRGQSELRGRSWILVFIWGSAGC